MKEALKRAYVWAATVALLNMLAMGGGVAYWFSRGGNAQRVRQAWQVLSGELVPGERDDDPAEQAVQQQATAAALSPEKQRVRDEIAWRNTERYRTQLEQRLKFINAERLEVDRRREEFERMQEQVRLARQKRAQRQAQAGYEKELEIVAALKPSAALEHLLTMDDGEAARVLFQLDTRKAKKIVEAAKTEAQMSHMSTLLKLVRDIKRDDAAIAQGEDGP